jgi:uncharacterized protein (DUF488 family)
MAAQRGNRRWAFRVSVVYPPRMAPRDIFSIGHSNHPIGHFIALLQRHGITALADVRSTPYSRFATQYNRETLAGHLRDAGIAYVFLGAELGGKRPGVSYDEIAATDPFRRGLDRLRDGAATYRVAFMCAERDPADCHRTHLVSRHLVAAPGLVLHHILADGTLEDHESVVRRIAAAAGPAQLPLLGESHTP